MRIEQMKLTIFGEITNVTVQIFEDVDREQLRNIWNLWLKLRESLTLYNSRSINLPEILSEGAWCLYSGSVRLIGHTSADTYNLVRGEAEQIKATSISNDLTSFGPKSKWDRLYFLDFSRLDGSFDAYEIPTHTLMNYQINANQTFMDQQRQGRRPRLCLIDFIKKYKISPIETNIRVF
jgi:hypothetical protein